MERLSWELTTRIAKRRSARIVALRRGNRWLPLFLGYSALLILANAIRGKILLLHLGDPALAPLGRLAKLCHVPVCVTVHGLDVTYPHWLYPFWLRIFLRDFDAYICISSAARVAAIAKGVPASRAQVIGVGVTAPGETGSAVREQDLLLFVGRLVKRKGLEWFVRAVLPRIAQRRDAVRLVIIGAGPERSAIQKAATGAGVDHRITWLGAVPESERMTWLSRAAVCVAPNVHVHDDIEGYGVVALEAAAAGCALVAADLEGLRDAIVDGQGGRLVPSEDADVWTAAIVELLDDRAGAVALGERAREWARSERNWENVCERYESIFNELEHRTHQ
jgi:glycosyltransferase involved in cell wall biosynthesis